MKYFCGTLKGNAMFNRQIKRFNELDTKLLYQILKLRGEIFIMEQQSPYMDPDGLDEYAYHFIYTDQDQLAAYLRIVPKEHHEIQKISIGRVCVHKGFRGQKLGRELMQQALQFIDDTLKEAEIYIEAQSYLQEFYQSLGFQAVSEEFMLDNVPHIEMIRKV